MCEFFDLQASGQNQDSNGVPAQIEVFGRVTLDCETVRVIVVNNQGDTVFDGVVTPETPVIPFNGVPTHSVRAIFPNTTPPILCKDRLSITLLCTHNLDCKLADTVELQCKNRPPDACPDSNDIEIQVTSNGAAVSLDQPCIAAGDFQGEAIGVPPGSQVFWTLQIGTNSTSLGSANPVSFTVPAGGDTASLIVTIIVPNCPPITKTVVLPDRDAGDCPPLVSFEIRKDGQIETETTNLESGSYTVTVLTPLGPGIVYTFSRDGLVQQSGASPSYSFILQGNGATANLLVTAAAGDCCPPVSATASLASAPDSDRVPEPEPEPGGNGTPPNGGNGNGDNGGGGISLCGFLYAVLMVLVVAFIALWIVSFAAFPVSAAVWTALAVAFVAIVALLIVMALICGMSFCRQLRVLAWMFSWCALGCIIVWVASVFVLWPLLIGVLIAGAVAIVIALVMAGRNCSFLNLFELP